MNNNKSIWIHFFFMLILITSAIVLCGWKFFFGWVLLTIADNISKKYKNE